MALKEQSTMNTVRLFTEHYPKCSKWTMCTSTMRAKMANMQELQRMHRSAGSKMVVVEFFTLWCRPCRVLSPQVLQALKSEKNNLVYCRVDMELGHDIATEYKMVAVPSFICFRRGHPMTKLVSSRMETVNETIRSLLGHDCRGITAKILFRGDVYCDRCRPREGDDLWTQIQRYSRDRTESMETEDSRPSFPTV